MMIGVHHLHLHYSTLVTKMQYKNSTKVPIINVYFFVRFAILLPVTENYKEHDLKTGSCIEAASAAGCEEENG